LSECLDEVFKKSADVASRVNILKYYENAHNEPCLNKEDSKVTKIFRQNYKANLNELLNEMELIFKKIRRELDNTSYPSESFEINHSKLVKTTFEIFSTTQFKGKLFCSDSESETTMEQKW